MIVECKKISSEVREKIRVAVEASHKKIRLAIIKAAQGDPTKDAEAEAFLKQKRACGKEVGIEVREYDVSGFLYSQSALENRVSVITRLKDVDAVIVQLPLPPLTRPDGKKNPVNTQAVLNTIPPKKDADVLHAESFGRYEAGSNTALVPPVIGALEEILRRAAPEVLRHFDTKVVVAVGQGLVIGKQVNRWAVRNGARELHSLREGSDVAYYAKRADIIVSGVGKAGLITADMVKNDAIIFDFGFSKVANTICGDVDFTVADKARLLTPVPGGMGPLSVTMLFMNVARIAGVKIMAV